MRLIEGVKISPKTLNNFFSTLEKDEIKMGFEVEFYHDSKDQIKNVLEHYFTETVISKTLSSFEKYKKDWNAWYIERDSSLETYTNGVEITSPVKNLVESLYDLNIVLKIIEEEDGITDSTTGLHINLSISNSEQSSPNWVKLSFLLGEIHILEQFDRVLNEYTKPQINNFLRFIKNHDVDKIIKNEGFNSLIEKLNSRIVAHKFTSFNIRNYERKNYIEFRMMGNKNYEKRFFDIRNNILKYTMMLKAAYSDTFLQREFIKKLASRVIDQRQEDVYDLKSKNYSNYTFSNKDFINLYNLVIRTADNRETVNLFRSFLKLMEQNNNLSNKKLDHANDIFLNFVSNYIRRDVLSLKHHKNPIKRKILHKIIKYFNIQKDWFIDDSLRHRNSYYIPGVTEVVFKETGYFHQYMNIIVMGTLFNYEGVSEERYRNIIVIASLMADNSSYLKYNIYKLLSESIQRIFFNNNNPIIVEDLIKVLRYVIINKLNYSTLRHMMKFLFNIANINMEDLQILNMKEYNSSYYNNMVEKYLSNN